MSRGEEVQLDLKEIMLEQVIRNCIIRIILIETSNLVQTGKVPLTQTGERVALLVEVHPENEQMCVHSVVLTI